MKRTLTIPLLACIPALALGCADRINHYHTTNVYGNADAGPDDPEPPPPPPPPKQDGGSEGPGNDDAGTPEDPDAELLVGAPKPNTSALDLDVDVFGTPGNKYWFAVSDEQLDQMNEGDQGGPIFIDKQFPGDIYTPGGQGNVTFVNRLFVSKAGTPTKTADFGKVQVRVVGQSTRRPWTPGSIPNLKVDTNEFKEKHEINDVEHIRFNNGLVGSIFREKLTLDIFEALGHAAPRATYAWVSSNVWGAEIEIPYTVVEVYKRGFCRRQGDAWGGDCSNMWEFVGDIDGMTSSPDNCQLTECDNTRAEEFSDVVTSTPQGEGFKDALTEWLDWDSFHQFQCLSWLLWIGDDTFHNSNNVVIVERKDGLFQYLPYSVDISAGQDWYQNTPLYGGNLLARGCQSDEQCWADTIATCEDTVARFNALDPVGMVDDLYNELDKLGMLRPGDDDRYEQLKKWYTDRVENAATELETYRELPTCQFPLIDCNGQCLEPWQCNECPVVEGDAGAPPEVDGGVLPPKPAIAIDEPMPGDIRPPPPICEAPPGKPIDLRPFDAYGL